MKGTSSKTTEKNFPSIEENTKSELAALGDLKNESMHDITNVEENIINPSKFTFSSMHTKEMFMKFTISCDGITQATSPYVSSISSTTSMRPRDPLQVPTTSLSFNESISGREVLTFATNYNASLSDTRSVLVDTVNRYDPSSIFNRVPQLSIEETFDQEPSNLRPIGSCSMNQTRQFRRTWGFRKFLRCFLPINEEIDMLPRSSGAPPAYSSIYAGRSAVPQAELSVVRSHILNDRRYFVPSINHSSFVAPTPPPSYAQAQGIQYDSYSAEQNMSASRKCLENISYLQQTLSVSSDASNSSWPSRSIATICPRCIALIVTTTEIRRSIITHLSAFLLCLCGCWPCCMIPYCLNSCKSIDHYCPVCRTYLGTYTPW